MPSYQECAQHVIAVDLAGRGMGADRCWYHDVPAHCCLQVADRYGFEIIAGQRHVSVSEAWLHLTYMIDIALTTEFAIAAGGAR